MSEDTKYDKYVKEIEVPCYTFHIEKYIGQMEILILDEWCREHCRGMHVLDNHIGGIIQFQDEKDADAFKLKWL